MTLLCLGSERVPGIGLGTRLRKEDQAAAVDSIPVWKAAPRQQGYCVLLAQQGSLREVRKPCQMIPGHFDGRGTEEKTRARCASALRIR